MQVNYFIGTDVSKGHLDFAVRSQSELLFHTRVSNSKTGLQSLETECKNHKVNLSESIICMEYTGVYCNILLSYGHQKGYRMWLEQPINIIQSLGMRRGKSDKVDAIRISEYCMRFLDKCKLWQPKRDEIDELRQLLNARNQLVNSKKRLKASVNENDLFSKRSTCRDAEKSLSPVIACIDKQVKVIEKKMDDIISGDEELKKLHEIVQSVDGVGKVTSWSVIISTNEFKDISEGKKFACYSGVVPFDYSSGSSLRTKSRISPLANKKMKAVFHMSAVAAIGKGKGELFEYYVRKVNEGKPKMSVINAIRNKIIQRIFACVKANRKYENSYRLKVA